jgi:hypothetical protein
MSINKELIKQVLQKQYNKIGQLGETSTHSRLIQGQSNLKRPLTCILHTMQVQQVVCGTNWLDHRNQMQGTCHALTSGQDEEFAVVEHILDMVHSIKFNST